MKVEEVEVMEVEVEVEAVMGMGKGSQDRDRRDHVFDRGSGKGGRPFNKAPRAFKMESKMHVCVVLSKVLCWPFK